MFKQSIRVLSAFAIITLSTTAIADTGAIGTWKTATSDSGSYLHVNVEQCGEDLCGTILQAFDSSDAPIADYENIGAKMIWDMSPKSDTSWAGGKIWDPSEDKTYKSKMSVEGDVLSVSGCVMVFCKSQEWTRL